MRKVGEEVGKMWKVGIGGSGGRGGRVVGKDSRRRGRCEEMEVWKEEVVDEGIGDEIQGGEGFRERLGEWR